MSTDMVPFTSAAVVITGRAPSLPAMSRVSSFAPPMCPDSTLMTKFLISSITITAGSVFLSLRWGAISLIVAPSENRHTSPSLCANSLDATADVCSAYQVIRALLPYVSANLPGAYTSHPGNASSMSSPVLMPSLVIASMATFSMRSLWPVL